MIGLSLQSLPDVATKPTAWLRGAPQYVLPTLQTLERGQEAASLFVPPVLRQGLALDTTLDFEADHAGLVVLLSSLLGGAPDEAGALRPQTRNFAPELPLLPLSLEAQVSRWQAEGPSDEDPNAIPLNWRAWDVQVSELSLNISARQTVRTSVRMHARRSVALLTGLTPPRDLVPPGPPYLFKHHFLQLEVARRWHTLRPSSSSLKLSAPIERLDLGGIATLETLGYQRSGPLRMEGEFKLHGPQRDLLLRHYAQEPLQLRFGFNAPSTRLTFVCWVLLRDVTPEQQRWGDEGATVTWQAVSLDEVGLLEVQASEAHPSTQRA